MVCRSLERMTALGIMDDHDRLLHPADGGSVMGGTAARNRLALATICIMVALGLLLCTGRESLAQQQGGVRAPAVPAAPQRLAGRAGGRARAARDSGTPGTADGKRHTRKRRTRHIAPASRPSGGHVQPAPAAPSGVPRTERKPPASRPAPFPPADPGAPIGHEKPAATPGRQGPPPQGPAHAPPDPPRSPHKVPSGRPSAPNGRSPKNP